tara:strand:- start:3612 stop:4040 length:429 start_codon:yes stop_codon:yes gene_type:complete
MADFNTGAEINAKQFEIYVGSASNQWKILQEARVTMMHPIILEPTTGGNVSTFTGAPNHVITGTLVFTIDSWTTGTFGLDALSTVTSSEVPINDYLVKFTGIDASTTTLTFANCKLSVVDISKEVDGGVKVDITIICPSDPS